MQDGSLTYTLEGKIATIVMDDGKANTLHPDFFAAFHRVLDQVEADEALALVITGRENRFSAGLDLKLMPTLGFDGLHNMLVEFGRWLIRLYLFPRPVIGASTGHAIAGGSMLMACCDVKLGVDGPYQYGVNEVPNGMIFPSFGFEIPKSVLTPRAWMQSIVDGRMYNPREAQEIGYLDEVLSVEQLMPRAQEWANKLSILPNPGYAATKLQLREPIIAASRDNLEEEIEGIVQKMRQTLGM